MLYRQPPLHLSFRRYQIGKAFDFDEIKFPVLKSPPRKLARLCVPATEAGKFS